MYARLAIDAPVPDLVVYLQAPVDVLLERIARRGIHYEQLIERRYLERLVEAYARFFLEYDAAPVLIVNAAEIDPVGSDADYASLLARDRPRAQGPALLQPDEEPAVVPAVDVSGPLRHPCGLSRGGPCTHNSNCGIRPARPSTSPPCDA